MTVLLYLLAILLSAFVGGSLFKLIKQPPVVGYLLAGTVLGFFFGNSTGHEAVGFLAELGIVLLLFTLGLEFSFSRMGRMLKVALIGAVVQIILTIWIQTLVMLLLNIDFFQALFMSAAFSLSSTAIVVKLLGDRGEIDSLPGEIMVTWLVVQDLAVLPLLILLPLLGKAFLQGESLATSFTALFQQLSLIALFLTGFLVFGKKIIPVLVNRIAALNNRELLLVGVFTVAIAGALFTQFLGLTAALGAFLAGLLISESAQQQAVFSEIRPLRDIFSLLFFATLGFLLPPGFLFANLGLILVLTLSVLLIKFCVVFFLTAYLGYHPKTTFIVGVGLIEVGEFAFILANVGVKTNVISQNTYGLILAVALLSILMMPPLFLAAPVFYRRLRERYKHVLKPVYLLLFPSELANRPDTDLPYQNHVVLCGYGRVGRYIGLALQMAQIPFVVIEYNHHTSQELHQLGIEVVYGDPADIDILDYAQVDKARAVVIAIPDLHTQQQVIANSLKLNQDILIYCRSHHEEHQKHLKNLGVTAIVQPEFEAALSITDKILRVFGTKPKDIEGKILRLKIEHGLG